MLILASTSRYRKALLARLGIEFNVIGSDYDERQHDHLFEESPNDCATTIAKGKADTVLKSLDPDSDSWVLGADQIVWMHNPEGYRIQCHKPGSTEKALEQLMQIRGQNIYSTTGVVLLNRTQTISAATTEVMHVRSFLKEEARAYVEKYKPIDCAGSFRMEDPGITLFEDIVGDWTGCQGFPLLTVAKLLRRAGLLPT